jgi:hypothetical protein
MSDINQWLREALNYCDAFPVEVLCIQVPRLAHINA